jgi:DNA-binding NarL/FixJ family response regulator
MPEKEGIETIMELKRDFPDVKIIAISGGGQIPSETCLYLAEKLGVQRTFTKPVPRQDMIKAVKELLEQGE